MICEIPVGPAEGVEGVAEASPAGGPGEGTPVGASMVAVGIVPVGMGAVTVGISMVAVGIV